MHFSVIKNVNFFHVIRRNIRKNSIVCSVIVPCTHEEINVEEISSLREMESKTAVTVRFRIIRIIMDI